jgi:pimeloyl-ACP methyl ester carboxylesterase
VPGEHLVERTVDGALVFNAHDRGFVAERTPDGNPHRDVLRITLVTSNVDLTGGVLVLPGGRPRSVARSRPWQLANLRVGLLARAMRRRLGPGVDVRLVRYRVRGWNPDRLDALRDARIALDALRRRFEPADIVVVGHSMGGRVAAHLAASGDVGAVAALAPWWPAADAGLVPVGCRLLTMHGTADTWTDPVAAQAQTVRAQERGVDARWVAVEGGGHFLLRDYPWWHRVTADFAMAQLAERSTP